MHILTAQGFEALISRPSLMCRASSSFVLQQSRQLSKQVKLVYCKREQTMALLPLQYIIGFKLQVEDMLLMRMGLLACLLHLPFAADLIFISGPYSKACNQVACSMMLCSYTMAGVYTLCPTSSEAPGIHSCRCAAHVLARPRRHCVWDA